MKNRKSSASTVKTDPEKRPSLTRCFSLSSFCKGRHCRVTLWIILRKAPMKPSVLLVFILVRQSTDLSSPMSLHCAVLALALMFHGRSLRSVLYRTENFHRPKRCCLMMRTLPEGSFLRNIDGMQWFHRRRKRLSTLPWQDVWLSKMHLPFFFQRIQNLFLPPAEHRMQKKPRRLIRCAQPYLPMRLRDFL